MGNTLYEHVVPDERAPVTPEPQNPVHMHSSPTVRWTTVNFAEAIQGVQKPLSWGMWDLSMETSVRRTFGAIGVLRRGEVPPPASADHRMSGIFYGRVAGNIEVFRRVGDGMPGSSGDMIEEKLFGKEPEGGSRKTASDYLRYPIVAAKLPRAARRAPRELPAMRADHGDWWRREVIDAPPHDLAGAQRLLREAADQFIAVGELHATATLVASALLDELGDLAERSTGDRSLAMDLATGYGSMEETALIRDLWEASRGRLDIDEVVRRHGYHGPDEGDLSSRTWREDRAPLAAILRSYAKKASFEDPRTREARQLERRRTAERALLAGLPRLRRPGARLVMRFASTYIPLREIGKASFLHALDAARCAARVGGRALAQAGALADPEDVFFLTFDEFLAEVPADLAARVDERRERHARYETLTLPPSWTGDPEPVPLTDGAPASGEPVTTLKGIGVVGDTVTGTARVVTDPMDADLDDGDILVCKTTDPSWTPLFMLADALVIDTGGAMSHGAIVARELGVTCVINTVTGTRDIPDGATITVDGSTGTVTVEPAAQVTA